MFEMMTSSRGASDEQGGWRKGPWTPEEDKLLVEYVSRHGEGRWSCASKYANLNRSGKSCRLRWVNYLRPGLKKGHITPQEEGIIIELHALWGNKWSTIARYLPGRTDNEIKNYWRTHFKKRKPSNPIRRSSTKLQTGEDDHDSKTVVIKATPNHHHHQEAGEATTSDAKNGKGEAASDYPSTIETVHPMSIYDHDDFVVPVDYNYLWGGLWNLDDQNCSSKMGTQIYNQANNHVIGIANNCSRVGDQLVYYT